MKRQYIQPALTLCNVSFQTILTASDPKGGFEPTDAGTGRAKQSFLDDSDDDADGDR